MLADRKLLTTKLLVLSALLFSSGCGTSAEDQARLDRINQRNRRGPEARINQSKQSFDFAVQEYQSAHSAGDGASAKSALNRILAQKDIAVEQCIAVIKGERSMNVFTLPDEIASDEREEELMLATGILMVIGSDAESAIPILEQLRADMTLSERVRDGAASALVAVLGNEE